MAISLAIPEKPKSCKRTYVLDEELCESFDQYVRAAKEQYPEVTESMILTEMLRVQMTKDRAFQQWRKTQGLNGQKTKEG